MSLAPGVGVVVIGTVENQNTVYNPNTLSWEAMLQPVIEGGTIVVGTVNQGTGGSSAWKVDGSAVTQPVSGPLTDAQLRALAVPVSGTFYQATQPVSAVTLPLPTGASTAVKQPALGVAGTASADVISVQGVANMTPV